MNRRTILKAIIGAPMALLLAHRAAEPICEGVRGVDRVWVNFREEGVGYPLGLGYRRGRPIGATDKPIPAVLAPSVKDYLDA